jgi:hypothetical protein
MLTGVVDESCLYTACSVLGDAMTRALPFTQAAAERAIKALRRQGMSVTGMTIKPDGAITVHSAGDGDNPALPIDSAETALATQSRNEVMP